MPVYEPATGQTFATIADSTAQDVDLAVRAARQAFDEGEWGKTTAIDRGRMLARLSGLITQHAAELAALESRDTGKPKSAGAADIAALARYFEYYGGGATSCMAKSSRISRGISRLRAARALWRNGKFCPGIIPRRCLAVPWRLRSLLETRWC